MPSPLSTAASLLLFTALGVLLVGGAPASTTGMPQAPAGLFVDAPVRGALTRSSRPTVGRSRPVTINPAAWPASQRPHPRSAPPALLLNLFEDVSYTAVLDRVEPASNGFTWIGHIPGARLSTVTLAAVDGILAGSVILPGAVYSIRNTGGAAHEVREVDQSQFLPEGEPIPVSIPPRNDVSVAADPIPLADPAPTIDVMVLYTPAAEASAGGTAAMAARITLSISETNTSYANSHIGQRLRLVYGGQVSYTEHDDLRPDLDNLTNNDGTAPLSTPLGHTAALLRDIHGADLVVLVTAPPSPNYCGIAWMMESVTSDFEAFAFSVVEEGCLSPNSTFAHEFGHNMGARHDWYVDNNTTPRTYAHGYVNTTERWRTIMAYNNLCSAQSFSCTRLLYWSNPDVSYDGASMGIPGGTRSDCPKGNVTNVSCDADDHRALNDTAATVSNFRSGGRRAASDFTPDLKSDILWRHATRGEVWLWPMDGAARLSETHVRTVPDTDWEIRGLGDQTGDGKSDILWRHKTSGQIYFWPMNGSTPLSETYVATVDTAYDIVGTGDYNGDGKSDILWRHPTNGEVWIWLMDGATPLTEVFVDRVDPAYVIKGSGDLDGDHKADIVWHHGTRGEVWVWLMDGTNRLSQTWVETVPDVGYQIVGVADHSGDGKADILWRHLTNGEMWVWLMDGATPLSEAYVDTVDPGYVIKGSGDMDGDHKADIVWHHATRGEVWVWLMDGTARLSETWVATVPEVGYQIVK